MEGLRYETTFDRTPGAGNTHVPYFPGDEPKYLQIGREVREFFPTKSIYAFRYYDNDGVLSKPWSATICRIEGEESECVVLAEYSQSIDYEESREYGFFNFWRRYPEIFFRDREREKNLTPYFRRVDINPSAGKWDEEHNKLVCGWAYDPVKEKIAVTPFEVQEYSVDMQGCPRLVSAALEEEKVFIRDYKCKEWCKKNFIVL